MARTAIKPSSFTDPTYRPRYLGVSSITQTHVGTRKQCRDDSETGNGLLYQALWSVGLLDQGSPGKSLDMSQTYASRGRVPVERVREKKRRS